MKKIIIWLAIIVVVLVGGFGYGYYKASKARSFAQKIKPDFAQVEVSEVSLDNLDAQIKQWEKAKQGVAKLRDTLALSPREASGLSDEISQAADAVENGYKEIKALAFFADVADAIRLRETSSAEEGRKAYEELIGRLDKIKATNISDFDLGDQFAEPLKNFQTAFDKYDKDARDNFEKVKAGNSTSLSGAEISEATQTIRQILLDSLREKIKIINEAKDALDKAEVRLFRWW
jgi:multidrug efflux pump subunit AcrA (membrane-fusion protein)